ncbi:MAG: TIGR03088 family PEP-CTERM/XrtA system glycosyltransferase [Proteobacteria bacterium]|nr:TIGR03088 family PEP-CTERM/XrtA system glycosyltransferase [Pseudomonadota bacterium]HNF64822.1 TIGR03088 family PEP-CTERM/XrtA system glycosyltransferase [Plasticicumulans sp.]
MATRLVAHVVHRLTVGGLENGVVNLINHLPADRFRHVVICMTDHTGFAARIRRADVGIIDLHKRPGHDAGLYLRLYRTLRRLRPDVVHTRNLGTQEALAIAWLAGVRGRVHGEHGWNGPGPEAEPPRRHRLRRWLRPFVSEYVALGAEIERYLQTRIGVPAQRIARIYNGVDLTRFGPEPQDRRAVLPAGFAADDAVVIGTVGRMQNVKDQPTLARAFVALLAAQPAWRARLRLVLVGDGELRSEVEAILAAAGARELAWLPGSRDDVPALLAAFDVFVLPSQAEGVSNTILEAMACARPVVATAVGANAELLVDGETGRLVPARDPAAMADALAAYAASPALRAAHGAAGRARIEAQFSLEAMVARYAGVYERALAG